MEWVVIGAIVWVIFAVRAQRKKKALTEQKCIAYSAEINTFKQSLITGRDTAYLTVLNAADHGYRPVASENLLAVQNGASRVEMRTTGRYTIGVTSVSIPIMKGMRHRVGSGSIHTEKSWQTTAYGRLLITDKAIIFEGDRKNERIGWTQVANIELLLNGFAIAKRSGPPRTYQVEIPDPKFAAVVDLMLARVG